MVKEMKGGKMETNKKDKQIPQTYGKLVFWSIFFLIALFILFGSIYTIGAGERGVLLTFGKPSEVAQGEGLHFKIPLIQKVVKMDVKVLKYDTQASSASRDLQIVSTEVTLNYHIRPETVTSLYRNIGVNYQDKIIQPAVQEVVKAVTAKYTAEELITERPSVKEAIDIALQERLSESNVIVDTISITNFDFSESFNEAIEAKVTAEQNALAAKNKLEQIKYEAEQAITQAKGQAEAQSLLAKSVTKDTIEFKRLEIQQIAIEKWNGQLPQVTGGAIPFISLNNLTI